MNAHKSPAHDPLLSGQRTNRRTQLRHGCSLVGEVEVLECGAHSKWPVRGLDLSQGGIGLIMDRRFEPGAMLGLLIHGPGATPPFTAIVRVVRAEGRAGGQWLHGCQFPCILDGDELAALADPNVRRRGDSSCYLLLNQKKQHVLTMIRERFQTLCDPTKP